MKKFVIPVNVSSAAWILICFSGCSTTIGGALFVFTFRDIVAYLFAALALGFLSAAVAHPGKRHTAFWLWFLLSILLTPIAGLLYVSSRILRKGNENNR